MEWHVKNGLNGDRLLTVTLGVSGEIEIWKMGKIRTFLQCQFVGQDVVRTFKKSGIKRNGVGKMV